MVCCITTSFIFLFGQTGPKQPCLGSIAEKTSFIVLEGNGPYFGHVCYARVDLFFVLVLPSDVIEYKRRAALMSIVRGDTLINNAVSKINVFCVGTLIFETKTILSTKYDI